MNKLCAFNTFSLVHKLLILRLQIAVGEKRNTDVRRRSKASGNSQAKGLPAIQYLERSEQ